MDTASAQPDKPSVAERGASIIAEMDEAGIDRSVVFLGDYGLRLGDAALMVEEENRLIASIGNSFAGRIVPFAGIDPPLRVHGPRRSGGHPRRFRERRSACER